MYKLRKSGAYYGRAVALDHTGVPNKVLAKCVIAYIPGFQMLNPTVMSLETFHLAPT